MRCVSGPGKVERTAEGTCGEFNALMSGCNQKTSREPLLNATDALGGDAVRELQDVHPRTIHGKAPLSQGVRLSSLRCASIACRWKVLDRRIAPRIAFASMRRVVRFRRSVGSSVRFGS